MTGSEFMLWLEFEHWIEEDAPIDYENNFCNMTITLPGGRAYALSVWTYAYCQQAMRESSDGPARLQGAYLLPPDLLVKRLDRKLIEAVVADLLKREELHNEWLVADEGDV
jgi:hypothetical protein